MQSGVRQCPPFHPRARWRRALLATLAVLAAGLVAAGCGGGSGSANGKTVVRFANWADAEDNTRPGIQAMIKAFERQHPNIEIKSEPISYTDIQQQVIREVQSGNAPDVAEMQGNYTVNLAQQGVLEPLGSYASGAYERSIIPRVLDLGRMNGQLVAVPWTVAPFALWYNKKVMRTAGLDPAKPPRTIDELLQAMAAVRRKQPKVIPFGLDTTNREFGLDANWGFMKAFGAQPFTDARATADTPQMKQYLEFIRTLATRKYSPVNQKAGFFRQPAASNQVAFLWDGPYPKGVIQATNGMSDKAFFATWGVTTPPAGPTGKAYSVPTDHQLVMFKSAKDKQAAWEFMKFLSTSETAILRYTIPVEGSLPPLADPPPRVARQLDNPIFRAFTQQVIPLVVRPEWGPGYSNAYSTVMSSVQATMTSSTPIDRIASQMQAQLQSELG
jgi:multiple sugar transport system substrate-binding protein